MRIIPNSEVYFFLPTATIQSKSGAWFGLRKASEVSLREVRGLLSFYCQSIKTSIPDFKKPPIGLNLVFEDKTQCLEFFNRFLCDDSALWIDHSRFKEANDLLRGYDHKLFVFGEDTHTCAIVAFSHKDDQLAFKLRLP